jgi:hypothetical protein
MMCCTGDMHGTRALLTDFSCFAEVPEMVVAHASLFLKRYVITLGQLNISWRDDQKVLVDFACASRYGKNGSPHRGST